MDPRTILEPYNNDNSNLNPGISICLHKAEQNEDTVGKVMRTVFNQ